MYIMHLWWMDFPVFTACIDALTWHTACKMSMPLEWQKCCSACSCTFTKWMNNWNCNDNIVQWISRILHACYLYIQSLVLDHNLQSSFLELLSTSHAFHVFMYLFSLVRTRTWFHEEKLKCFSPLTCILFLDSVFGFSCNLWLEILVSILNKA